MTNHMRKLEHLYHPIVWCKCKSLQKWWLSYALWHRDDTNVFTPPRFFSV